MTDTETRLFTLIAQERGEGYEASDITPATRLRDDLGFSDKQLDRLIADVESEYGVSFSDIESLILKSAAKRATVSDVLTAVNRRLSFEMKAN